VRAGTDRKGTIILGAGTLARRIAHTLLPGQPVRLVDTNPARCHTAKAEGLTTICGNALREQIMADAHAAEAQTVVALTPNSEVNALAGQLARSVFMVPELVVVHEGEASTGHQASLAHLGASTLFGGPVAVGDWDMRVSLDQVVENVLDVDRETPANEWRSQHTDPSKMLPIGILRDNERLIFHSGQMLQPGDQVVVLEHVPQTTQGEDRFDEVAASCPILDIVDQITVEQLFARAADELSGPLRLPPEKVFDKLWQRERTGSTVLDSGLAIPHLIMDGEGCFAMLIIRCRRGVHFPTQNVPVKAVFVIASSADERNFYLRALSAIAQIVHADDFGARWIQASGPAELRQLVVGAERKRW
jgi:mannitol/fructose-specific phosphotransferase system IIA component (Ntr-type)